LLREPMFAAKMHTVPTGPQWLMEPKFDGWRVVASTIGGMRLETRTGNLITQVPYIAQAVLQSVPPDTIIDGEIVNLRGASRQWNRTQTILSTTRGGYQHKPTEDDPPLTYVVFDVLQIAGEDVRHQPLSERKRQLLTMLDAVSSDGVLMHSPIYEASEEGLDELVAEGFEGVVLKDINSIYVCGGRRHGWGKIKAQGEIEAICTGAYPAEPGSKYAPVVDGVPKPWAAGGLCFRVEHGDGRVYEGRAAGMDDRLRRELHEHPARFEGLVVELVHWGVQESGALRHPNFKRFRSPSDKQVPTPEGRPAARRQTARPKPPTPTRSAQRRMRNYAAMGAPKLRASIDSLRKREGEAYEKCINLGSGDPAQDLVVAERIAREKHLI
jgi:ATP-dependent DNA ligase